MPILKVKNYRAKLESKGVRVSNDLTHRQATIVSQARKEGKAAYFVKGKLIVGPRRPDPRTYAEVAAGKDVADTQQTNTRVQSAAHSPTHTHADTHSTSTHSPIQQLPHTHAHIHSNTHSHTQQAHTRIHINMTDHSPTQNNNETHGPSDSSNLESP